MSRDIFTESSSDLYFMHLIGMVTSVYMMIHRNSMLIYFLDIKDGISYDELTSAASAKQQQEQWAL